MSKINKPVWILFSEKGRSWGPFPTRQQARDIAYEPGDRVVKYIPAPVAPKAPKPAPKPVAVLTDWIPCETPPVRVGVYERNDMRGLEKYGTVYQYWDGCSWGPYCEYSERAAELRHAYASVHQSGVWRGYTTPQE
jgi:hypothetical protein